MSKKGVGGYRKRGTVGFLVGVQKSGRIGVQKRGVQKGFEQGYRNRGTEGFQAGVQKRGVQKGFGRGTGGVQKGYRRGT